MIITTLKWVYCIRIKEQLSYNNLVTLFHYSFNGTARFKNVNNCLDANIYSYLDIFWSKLYSVFKCHSFFDTSVNLDLCGRFKQFFTTLVSNKCSFIFRAIGFYNEADTFESSSILIYSWSMIGLYTWRIHQDAALIKVVIKLRSQIKCQALLIKLGNKGLEKLLSKFWANAKYLCNQSISKLGIKIYFCKQSMFVKPVNYL
jgi:hypothetical protein